MSDPVRSNFFRRRTTGESSHPTRRSQAASSRKRRRMLERRSGGQSLHQEKLENRLALAISIADVPGFVNIAFRSASTSEFVHGYAVIASDQADDVYVKQVSTVSQDLLVADNSSFLNYQHIDGIDADINAFGQAYRDVYVTNGSRVTPTNPLTPVTTASTTTTFKLGIQDFWSSYAATGSITYTQSDGAVSVWQFANYSSPDALSNFSFRGVPDLAFGSSTDFTFLTGPGYPAGQAAAVSPGWVRPVAISYADGQNLVLLGNDIGQATITIEWSGPVDPTSPPALAFRAVTFDGDTNGGVYSASSLLPLISATNTVSFALPDPWNLDSLGVIPGAFAGSLTLGVAGRTGLVAVPVQAQPDGRLMFNQTVRGTSASGYNDIVSGWTDIGVIQTDAGGVSGEKLVRGIVRGNTLTLTFSEGFVLTGVSSTRDERPTRGTSASFEGFLTSRERAANVATFASLTNATYLVYNQDTQPNDVTFAPGHTFTREPTVDLLTSGSTLTISSPIDVGYEIFNGTSTPPKSGSVDFRVTNIDVQAPVFAPGRVDIGHSQIGDTERLTGFNRFGASPTLSRTYQPSLGQTATAYAAVNAQGQVTSAAVLTPGSGYDQFEPPQVIVEGPTANNGAAVVTAISGSVTRVAMNSSGSGYTNGASATFSRPETGFLGSINVNFGGSGYTSAPYVEIVGGGGTGAAATATVVGDRVTAITITNPGRDYVSAPTIRLIGGGGRDATALSQLGFDTARGDAVVVDGRVVAISITNPGAGYTAVPTISITGLGGGRPGQDAAATATIQADVGSVRVALSGANYLNGGTGFIDARVTSSDIFANFADVRIPVLNGELRDDYVSRIVVVDGGAGYDSATPPSVTLLGGTLGTTNTATAVVRPEDIVGGVIQAITITSNGRQYVTAPRVIIGGPPTAAPAARTAAAYAEIAAVEYLSRGSGYTGLNALTVEVPDAPPGTSNAPAEFAAIVSPDGRVVGLTLVDPGSGYSVPPRITIAPPPYQRAATATATIDAVTGGVTSITVVDQGYRYKTAPRVVVESPAKGMGVAARAVARLDVSGRVIAIDVIDPGSGYTQRPRVEIAIPTPVSHTEWLNVDANLRAPVYEIYVGDDAGTEREKGLVSVAPNIALAQKPVNGVSALATDLYVEATTADIVVEGAIRATRQTYLLNSDGPDARLAPYFFTTRSLKSNLQNDSAIIEGSTVAITLGNDTPTPASGSQAFNVVDLVTRIDSLRMTAATSTPNPAGAFPYQVTIREVDGISIDAVAASSLPISISAGGNIGMTSALATEGDLSINSAAAFTVSSPISSSLGQIVIEANDIQVNNSVRVTSAAVVSARPDISLFARAGSIRIAGDVTAVNDISLRQQVGTDGSGLPRVGGQIDAINARVTADTILVNSGGSVSMRTAATTLIGRASTGFTLREADDIAIPQLEVPAGLVLLEANGVDKGDKGRNVIAMTARLTGDTNLFVSTPNGSADVTVDTNRELVLGNGPELLRSQGAAEAMQAAGDVTIRSLGGSVVALDAPLAGGSARAVRLATQAALPSTTTYTVGVPGVFGSTLSGNGSINALVNSVFGMPASTVLAVGDLLLVKNQVDFRQNGIYRVTKVGGGILGSTRWEITRDAASDTTDELLPGSLVRVLEGPDAVANRVYATNYDAIPTQLVERTNGNQIQLRPDFPYDGLVSIGQAVTGTGIAPNSQVALYDPDTNVVTLDVAWPASTPRTAEIESLSPTGNSFVVKGALPAGLAVGQPVYNRNIDVGARVTKIDEVAKTVYVTPGSVKSGDPGTATTVVFGVAGVVDTARTTDSTIFFTDSFTRYGQLSVGNAVFGDGISPGARITRIDPLTKSINVTPGSVPRETTVQVGSVGTRVIGGVALTYPEFFDTAIQLAADFNDYVDIRVGQLVSGPVGAFAAGARVTGIDPVNRTIGLNAGAIANPAALLTAGASITFEQPTSVSFGVVDGRAAGYATFALPTIGQANMTFSRKDVTNDIGSDDATKPLTFVVATTGTTNSQAGSLGKMLSLLQNNDTSDSPTNADQETSFRFWQYNPGTIRLVQELPLIDSTITIDGSLRYTGAAGVIGVTPSQTPIIVDGSLITATRRGSNVSPASFTLTGSTAQGNVVVTLGTGLTTVNLQPGMVVRGDGIPFGARVASIQDARRFNLDKPALATIATSSLTFRVDSVNGFEFKTAAPGDRTADGSQLQNLTIGGFASGAAIVVDGSRNILIDRLVVGATTANLRNTNGDGIVLTNNAAFNTVRDSRIIASSRSGIRIDSGATENRVVGTTVGTAEINNLTGIEIAASRNFIGVDEIAPFGGPRTISVRVVSDSGFTPGRVLEVSGGLTSFTYPLIGLQLFDTAAVSDKIPVEGGSSPVRIVAVDSVAGRIFLDNPLQNVSSNSSISLLLGQGGTTTSGVDTLQLTTDSSVLPSTNIDDLFVGQAVTGANIASGTVIAAIDRDTRTITLSLPAVGVPDSQSWGWVAFGTGGRNTVQSNRYGIDIVTGNDNRVTNTSVINNTFDGVIVKGGVNNQIGSQAASGMTATSTTTPPADENTFDIASYAVNVNLVAGKATVVLPATFPAGAFSALGVGMPVFSDGLANGVVIKSKSGTTGSRSITLSAAPTASRNNVQLSFGIGKLAGVPFSALFVGQTMSAVNLTTATPAISVPDYTTITAIRTPRRGDLASAPFVRGRVVVSTPQTLTGITVGGFAKLPGSLVTFARMSNTSNAIYGNRGYGVNVVGSSDLPVTGRSAQKSLIVMRTNFNVGLSGEQQALNAKGQVIIGPLARNMPTSHHQLRRSLDFRDYLGNRYAVARLTTVGGTTSTGGTVRPPTPGRPTV